MSSLPTLTSPVFCSDEDCLVYAAGDFLALTPQWQLMAQGVDGVFAQDAPWVLTSASVDFQSQGLGPNNVVWLTAPKSQYPGGGHAFAVDSVSGNSVTLRRPYKDLNVGQSPAPMAGLSAVAFVSPTLDPQITQASYDIKQRFAIDDLALSPAGVTRSSSFIYDLQNLRAATVYAVLVERYSNEARSDRGDFQAKVKRFEQKLADALARVQVRWGPTGVSAEPTTLFGCRAER